MIPDKSQQITVGRQDKTLKRGSLQIHGCDIEGEDDKAMAIVLNAIFGWENDLEEEEKNLEQNFAHHMKIRLERIETKPLLKGKTKTKSVFHKHPDNNAEKNGPPSRRKTLSNQDMIDSLSRKKQVYFRNVNVKIKPGEKVALVGEDDSGVKEFFDALLGENYITKGIVRQRGRIVYLDAQNSVFITGETLRNNILMGEKYEPDKYNKILKCVGLEMTKYKGGDLTEVLKFG